MTGPENERLEQELEEQLSFFLPDEDTVEYVCPWRMPVRYITWGLILNGITLHFLYLQYILPTVGMLLSYLGFRTLRQNGRAFRLAWAIALVQLWWQAASLVLNATPASGRLAGMGDRLPFFFAAAYTAARLVQLLALRAGLLGVFRRAGLTPEGDPLKNAAILQAVMLIMALSPLQNSGFAVLVGLIVFLVIMRALLRVGDALSGAGYCFTAAPVHVSSGRLSRCYLLGCLLLTILCSLWANHPRLNAAARPDPDWDAARQALVSLGLPEEYAADLSGADVQALAGASYAETITDVIYFESFHNGSEAHANGAPAMEASTSYLELPGGRIAVLLHFEWKKGSAYWNDAFMVSSHSADTQSMPVADQTYPVLSGQLLYEKGGQSWAAPAPRLQRETLTVSDFFGSSTGGYITGNISFPFGAKRQRGYVLFITEADSERLYCWTNWQFWHNFGGVQLPYRPASDRLRYSGLGANNWAQQYTTFDRFDRAGLPAAGG